MAMFVKPVGNINRKLTLKKPNKILATAIDKLKFFGIFISSIYIFPACCLVQNSMDLVLKEAILFDK